MLQISDVRSRAKAIADAGSLDAALASGALPESVAVSVSEGLLLGLLRQGVRKYLVIFGHGNTDFGNVLRVYAESGVVRVYHCRNEVSMAHAATVLRWQFRETPAVVTSIGPGALHAMAGSLAAASNGVGVYHIYGDETTHGEGYNMQQIPRRAQNQYGRLTETMGASYTLHTPQALREAMRRGIERVFHPYFAGPFYLMLPINMQPAAIERLNLNSLPSVPKVPRLAPVDDDDYARAAALIREHSRIVIKAGGGSVAFGDQVQSLAETADAVVALSPGALGVLPDDHPRNMHVAGSKGSLSGNYATEHADLVVVIGSRAVCQSDSSGTAYEQANAVININGDIADATHYNRTVSLIGDIGAVIEKLVDWIRKSGSAPPRRDEWLQQCGAKKAEWKELKQERCSASPVMDPAWGRAVLTQPTAIRIVADFAHDVGACKYFDAGDVQANGFQIVEDDEPGQTFTETGASYMGFAASAVLAAVIADDGRYPIAFSGDGSFIMQPQVLIDASVHNARGMIVVFDNRRMAAISALQCAQYDGDFATSDSVAIDFVRMASAVGHVKGFFGGYSAGDLSSALHEAYSHDGLSVVHVPVYWGVNDPGMGVYGRWNVGPWCDEVQALYHDRQI